MPNTHPLTAEHRRHDRLLVARHAVGDTQYGQDHEAQELIRRCSECAALAADISAISRAVGELPVAPRPRDFRLTSEQAASLRGSRLERWLRTISSSGWQTVRPVAAVALSVGMVMSIVGFVPILGSATPSALDTSRSGVGAIPGTPAPLPTFDIPTNQETPVNPILGPGMGSFASPEPPAGANIDNVYLQPTPAGNPAPGETTQIQKPTTGAVGLSLPQLVLLVGLGLTILALAVLVLLYAARRRFYDPLLR